MTSKPRDRSNVNEKSSDQKKKENDSYDLVEFETKPHKYAFWLQFVITIALPLSFCTYDMLAIGSILILF